MDGSRSVQGRFFLNGSDLFLVCYFYLTLKPESEYYGSSSLVIIKLCELDTGSTAFARYWDALYLAKCYIDAIIIIIKLNKAYVDMKICLACGN